MNKRIERWGMFSVFYSFVLLYMVNYFMI